MKSMLQSKQSDQFDTLHLIHVVVVVSSFRCECFLRNSFFLFWRKAERGWKWREIYRWPAKKAKANVNIDCFSLIIGQWKLSKGQWKVREKSLNFWLSDEWQPCNWSFLLDQTPEDGKRGWGVIIKGRRLFWIFPSKGGDSSSEVINWAPAFIQGSTVWIFYYLPSEIFFVTLDETSSYWICWIFRELHDGT